VTNDRRSVLHRSILHVVLPVPSGWPVLERQVVMDPNETLRRIRELSERGYDEDDAASVVEAFRDLDEWLSKGGFLPSAWSWEATGENEQLDPDRPMGW